MNKFVFYEIYCHIIEHNVLLYKTLVKLLYCIMSVDLSMFAVKSFIGVLKGRLPKDVYKCVRSVTSPSIKTSNSLVYNNIDNPQSLTIIRPLSYHSLNGCPVTLTELIPITRFDNQVQIDSASLGYPIITDSTIDENGIGISNEELLQVWREVLVDFSTTPPFVVRDTARKTSIASKLDYPPESVDAYKMSNAVKLIIENKPTWTHGFSTKTQTLKQ